MSNKSRFRISKHAKNDVLPVIDNQKYLKLGPVGSTQRLVLYLYAVALGASAGETPGQFKGGDDFIQSSTLESMPRYESLLAGFHLANLDESEVELVSDIDALIRCTDPYANAGFEMIEAGLNDEYDREAVVYEQLEMLQERYDELFPSNAEVS